MFSSPLSCMETTTSSPLSQKTPKMTPPTLFEKLSDDLLLNIFFKLEQDPRNWARLACVCTKFSSLIRTVCWRSKCNSTIPSLVADLLPSSVPGGWSSLYKLAVCCPGLFHSGVLLEHSDFGLERELGPDENFLVHASSSQHAAPVSDCGITDLPSSWSLFDDLYYDTVYKTDEGNEVVEAEKSRAVERGGDLSVCKKRKVCRSERGHLASGAWSLSREQGNKLLASRFRGDCLYICDWPGCVHMEEKRNYMLFRGVFKDFKRSRVWRTINDGNRSKIDLNCAFCGCKETWDLHSAFCLRRGLGYHDDGEPVVRAYVCENGHVSGAWTDQPLYT